MSSENSVNTCKRCKVKVVNAVKCVECQCTFHLSCAKLNNNVESLDISTFQCCIIDAIDNDDRAMKDCAKTVNEVGSGVCVNNFTTTKQVKNSECNQLDNINSIDNGFMASMCQLGDGNNIDIRIFKYILKQKDDVIIVKDKVIEELQSVIKLLKQNMDLLTIQFKNHYMSEIGFYSDLKPLEKKTVKNHDKNKDVSVSKDNDTNINGCNITHKDSNYPFITRTTSVTQPPNKRVNVVSVSTSKSGNIVINKNKDPKPAPNVSDVEGWTDVVRKRAKNKQSTIVDLLQKQSPNI
ncbi:hypothetical protein C0J52_00791 [Blattella germanica]|nr:hypothetical protein C0J52_00791 [Blattella germanica]